jgi:hypothetical protein
VPVPIANVLIWLAMIIDPASDVFVLEKRILVSMWSTRKEDDLDLASTILRWQSHYLRT